MRFPSVNKQSLELYRGVLFENECGGNSKYVYRFENASERSGFSFGVCQLDITHNPYAMLALKEMECFTTDEITRLRAKDKTLNMPEMNARLFAHKIIVDKYDEIQINDSLSRVCSYCIQIGCDFKDIAAFLSCADYDNQFGMSKGGKLWKFLQAQTIQITAEMIRDYKYTTTAWGQAEKAETPNNPNDDDVLRRYNGIIKATGGLA